MKAVRAALAIFALVVALTACSKRNPLLDREPDAGSAGGGGAGTTSMAGFGGTSAVPPFGGTGPMAGDLSTMRPEPPERFDAGPVDGDYLVAGVCVDPEGCPPGVCTGYRPRGFGECDSDLGIFPDRVCGKYALRGGLFSYVWDTVTGEQVGSVLYDDTGGYCDGRSGWLFRGYIPDLSALCPDGPIIDCSCYGDDDVDGGFDDDDAGVADSCVPAWLLDQFKQTAALRRRIAPLVDHF